MFRTMGLIPRDAFSTVFLQESFMLQGCVTVALFDYWHRGFGFLPPSCTSDF
jgi:hypothetical protein